MFKSTFEHKDFYNQFFEHFKKSNQKITAVTEIKAYCDVLSSQEKKMMDEVSENYQVLKDITEAPSYANNSSEQRHGKNLSKAMRRVLNELDKLITNEDHINFPKVALRKLKKVIGKSFDEDLLTYYPASECIKKAEEICKLGGIIDKYRGKQRCLNKLLQQVTNDGYPAKLKAWEQLSNEEKKELTGGAKKRHDQKEKDYPEIMPIVVEIAVDIMEENKKTLSFYVTKNNDISSNLYSQILIKSPKNIKGRLTKDRLRGWLKKDLRSGKLEKLLDEERNRRQK